MILTNLEILRQRYLQERWQFDEWRSSLSAPARTWSERILNMSGFAGH